MSDTDLVRTIDHQRAESDRLAFQLAGRDTAPALTSGLFLQSLPKAGTHLLRNLLLTLIPPDQTPYREPAFIEDVTTWGALAAADPIFLWGHLPFGVEARLHTAGMRRLLLIRDPQQYVLSLVRFLYATVNEGALALRLRREQVPVDTAIRLVIEGSIARDGFAGVATIYEETVLGWLPFSDAVVRYEDLCRHLRTVTDPASSAYFHRMLSAAGRAAVSEDWRERLVAAASPQLSWTAREQLTYDAAIPPELSRAQSKMLEDCAPGLRHRLGYS